MSAAQPRIGTSFELAQFWPIIAACFTTAIFGCPPSHSNPPGYFTRPFNHTGQPAASIPCGLTPENLPLGLQVLAPLGGEVQLIAALRVIEAELGARMTPVEIAKQ